MPLYNLKAAIGNVGDFPDQVSATHGRGNTIADTTLLHTEIYRFE